MFGAGFLKSQALLKQTLAESEEARARAEEARDRRRRRMHSADAEALQRQIDELRLHVAALFRLLVARGVFTAEEAQRLEAEWGPASELGGAARDVLTGSELPPEDSPFAGLSAAGSPRKQRRRWWWVRFGAAVLALTAYGIGLVWLGVWGRQP